MKLKCIFAPYFAKVCFVNRMANGIFFNVVPIG